MRRVIIALRLTALAVLLVQCHSESEEIESEKNYLLLQMKDSNRPLSHLKKPIDHDEHQTVGSIVEAYESWVKAQFDETFESKGLSYDHLKLSFLVFKEEEILSMYLKHDDGRWIHVKDYSFTAFSGQIGPKLKQGDRQIPEGIYSVEYLNPNSSYHLSLKVSYPNAFDREMAKKDGRTNLGGDIMIHGRDMTIGCIPIGDENMEEVFVLAAAGLKQGIPVIIAPHDFRKNSSFPQITGVDWEAELYQKIAEELKKYSL